MLYMDRGMNCCYALVTEHEGAILQYCCDDRWPFSWDCGGAMYLVLLCCCGFYDGFGSWREKLHAIGARCWWLSHVCLESLRLLSQVARGLSQLYPPNPEICQLKPGRSCPLLYSEVFLLLFPNWIDLDHSFFVGTECTCIKGVVKRRAEEKETNHPSNCLLPYYRLWMIERE